MKYLKNNSNKDRHSNVTNSSSEYQQSQKSRALSENSEKISITAWKVLAILSLIVTIVTYAETMLFLIS
ncbi:MAG: hypothetical protein WA667_09155 [Candidatus Nitrosopolaris sp.]